MGSVPEPESSKPQTAYTITGEPVRFDPQLGWLPRRLRIVVPTDRDGPLPDPGRDELGAMRFGRGQLFNPHGEEARIEAWRLYLGVLPRVVPAVLTSLLSEEGFAVNARRDAEPRVRPLSHSVEFDDYIRRWCRRWGLSYRYAQNTAMNTLNHAARAMERGEPLPVTLEGFCMSVGGSEEIFNPGTRQYEEVGRVALRLDCLAEDRPGPPFRWNPTHETKAAAMQRIVTALREDVASALDRIEAEKLAAGLQPVPTKRELVHFEWLARYQILRETYDEIAGRERTNGRAKASRQLIEHGVKATAALLGLEPLRDPDRRGGRPRVERNPRVVKLHPHH